MLPKMSLSESVQDYDKTKICLQPTEDAFPDSVVVFRILRRLIMAFPVGGKPLC